MIIEELKKYLRATIIANPDMMKREYALELLEKIIAMETKLDMQNAITIKPPYVGQSTDLSTEVAAGL